MSADKKTLLTGHPKFSAGAFAGLAHTEGDLAAWEKLFATHGASGVKDVAGDFAVGLTDGNGRTILAVDRFAVRSLCYRVAGGGIYFASRADELADVDTEIDAQAIFDYLYFHVIPSPRTIFKNVYRLPPGHYAVFENGQLGLGRYWTPDFQEEKKASFDQLRTEFRHLLAEGVRRQLDGSKPACFLSGGTDSSTVAGMIGQVSGQAAATYSIGFDAEGYDEMEYARIAARHFHTDHHEYYVTPADLVRSIPDVARFYDQPFGNSSALPAYYCAKMAQEDGVTRILAGDGGDELFGGNTRYAKQKVFGFYDQLPSALRHTLLEPLLLGSPLGKLPLLSKGASYIRQAKVPLPDRTQTYNLLFRFGVHDVFTADFLEGVDQAEPVEQQRAIWAETGSAVQTNKELAFDWRYTLAECDLPKVVGTAMLAGIDVGFPMLDADLLAFSMRLPTEYKLKGLKLRWFFKEALRGFLPDEILTKKKQGFGLPFGVWVTQNNELRDLAENSVRALAERKIFKSEFVDQIFKHLREHPGYYGEMIWISIMLEQWLRGHDDKCSGRNSS
ncbi:asparagine synthase [Dechloromonas denitrificans]|uniref:asparagine synthase (glutamine-hydrolyzing) n=1 Tax=Dechloromonas denitrificans TaxID=281362 RepID=A0A133XKC1_9RHOO|nr:asparagine synthase C-terminal domain-containing protein [Dechloromonas denitrificans]KXB31380.1 asparagine synthase [Dechloromonas denitrificans]